MINVRLIDIVPFMPPAPATATFLDLDVKMSFLFLYSIKMHSWIPFILFPSFSNSISFSHIKVSDLLYFYSADSAAVAITTTDLVSKSVAIESKVWNSLFMHVYALMMSSLLSNHDLYWTAVTGLELKLTSWVGAIFSNTSVVNFYGLIDLNLMVELYDDEFHYNHC